MAEGLQEHPHWGYPHGIARGCTVCIRVAAGRLCTWTSGVQTGVEEGRGAFLLDATTTDLTRCKFYASRKKIPAVTYTLSFISIQTL